MSYSSSGSDSVCASPLLSHSSVSNSKQQSPGGPRVLKRLPKRIRLDPHVHVAQQELKQEQQHAATAEPKQLSSSSSSSKARVSLAHKLQQQSDVDGSLPALDSSDATSAENEDALPCTPPTEQSHHHQQQSFYQPLFAPVDHIVKQAALSTSLFAPAVSASSCDAASSSSNSSGLSHEQLAPHQPGDVHVVKEEDEVFPEADEDQLHFWDTSAADQTVRHQPAPHSRSNSSNNNNKKRKVPQQLVPTDRSLVSDHGDSEDDVASDEHLHYHDHTYAHANEHAQQQQQGDYGHGSPLPPSASCQDVDAAADVSLRTKSSRLPYTCAKALPKHHSPKKYLLRSPLAPATFSHVPYNLDGTPRVSPANAATAAGTPVRSNPSRTPPIGHSTIQDDRDDDYEDPAQCSPKKSVKHAKVGAATSAPSTPTPSAALPPPWSTAESPSVLPQHILPNLYEPDLGMLYPPPPVLLADEEPDADRAELHHRQQQQQQRRELRRRGRQSDPLPQTMTLDTFSFQAPLSPIVASRLEDLRNERERQQLAKELALERERLRAKEAELMNLKRREMAAAAQANSAAAGTAEARREYAIGGMQTEVDASLSEGKVIYASKWSESGPPGGMSTSKGGKGGSGAAGDGSSKKPSSSKKKKKKRAAHANANNHHHRDNYVPSRQPRSSGAGGGGSSGGAGGGAPHHGQAAGHSGHGGHAHGHASAPTDSSALPLPSLAEMPSLGLVPDDNVFSTASFHPQLGLTHLTPFFVRPDEWICSWCELALLFGDDDHKINQLAKKRKHALKVRKKAQRRAAKAAAGQLPPKDKKKKGGNTAAANGDAHNGQAQAATRKYASVQTVPEGEDPHVLPAPPVTAAQTDRPAATSSNASDEEYEEDVVEEEEERELEADEYASDAAAVTSSTEDEEERRTQNAAL